MSCLKNNDRLAKIDVLPVTLGEALDATEKNSVVQEALGAKYAEMYLKVKQEKF